MGSRRAAPEDEDDPDANALIGAEDANVLIGADANVLIGAGDANVMIGVEPALSSCSCAAPSSSPVCSSVVG